MHNFVDKVQTIYTKKGWTENKLLRLLLQVIINTNQEEAALTYLNSIEKQSAAQQSHDIMNSWIAKSRERK